MKLFIFLVVVSLCISFIIAALTDDSFDYKKDSTDRELEVKNV